MNFNHIARKAKNKILRRKPHGETETESLTSSQSRSVSQEHTPLDSRATSSAISGQVMSNQVIGVTSLGTVEVDVSDESVETGWIPKDKPLQSYELLPNIALKAAINDWQAHRAWQPPQSVQEVQVTYPNNSGVQVNVVQPHIKTPPVLQAVAFVGFDEEVKGDYVQINDSIVAHRVQDSQNYVDQCVWCRNPMQQHPNEVGVFASFRIVETVTGFNGPTFGVGPGVPPAGRMEMNDFLEESCWRIEFAGSVWFRTPGAYHEATHDWNRPDLKPGDVFTIHIMDEREIVVYLNDHQVLRLRIPNIQEVDPLPYPNPVHAFFCANGVVKEVCLLDVREVGLPKFISMTR